MFIKFTSPQNRIFINYSLWITNTSPQFSAVLFNADHDHLKDFLADNLNDLFRDIKEYLEAQGIEVYKLDEVSNILEPQNETEEHILSLITKTK